MKKILGILFLLVSVLVLLSAYNAFASKADGIASVYDKVDFDDKGRIIAPEEALFEGSLYDAVDFLFYSQRGGVIILNGDIKLNKGLTLQPANDTTSCIIIDGNVTIDLNGYSITQQAGTAYSKNAAIVVPKNSRLRLIDSSDKNGAVNGVQYGICVEGGLLNLSGGQVMAQAQASMIPDDAELPVVLKKSGELRMDGGCIIYHGDLDDGRTYFEKSCAIYADSTSMVKIDGGIVEGEIDAVDTNFTVSGGTFDFDVSEKLSGLYKSVEKDGQYTVEYALPEIKGENCEVSVDAREKDGTIYGFDISVKPLKQGKEEIRLNISELLYTVKYLGDSVSEICFNTDFMSVVFGPDAVGASTKITDGENIFLVLKRNYNIIPEIKERINNAVYTAEYFFENEKGKVLYAGIDGTLIIHHSTRNAENKNAVHGYKLEKTEIYEKNIKFSDDSIVCSASDREKLLIAEGVVLEVTGFTMNFEGRTDAVFYAKALGVEAKDTKMLFWTSPQTKYTEDTAERVVGYSTKDKYGLRFVYENISAKDMNKQIYVRIAATDTKGNTVYGDAPTTSYSVVKFAEINQNDKNMRLFLTKLLNYGAAAQEYFGSKDALVNMNKWMSDAERKTYFIYKYKNLATSVEETTHSGKCTAEISGKTLVFDGDVSINYYVSSDGKYDEIGLLIWNEEAFDKNKNHIMGTQSKIIKKFGTNGIYKVFSLKNIVASDFSKPVYARVYTKTNGVYKYSDIDVYSVKDYAAKQIEKNTDPKLVKLLKCLLVYGEEYGWYIDSIKK